jgi:hypothetical protein
MTHPQILETLTSLSERRRQANLELAPAQPADFLLL